MLEYILFAILITANGEIALVPENIYDTQYKCFDARERVVEEIGRPIVNYQVICVATNRLGETP